MADVSSQSARWFNPVDLGAATAVLLAACGVLWSPKLSNAVAQATGGLDTVTVMVDVWGAPSADPEALMASAESEGKVSLVIRNQPHGSVKLERIIPLQRTLNILTSDGQIVSAPDPKQSVFSSFDGRFVLKGQGRKAGGGVVFGNQTIEIGAPVELEGSSYRFGGTVTNLTFTEF